jgi:hypothetical protein
MGTIKPGELFLKSICKNIVWNLNKEHVLAGIQSGY